MSTPNYAMNPVPRANAIEGSWARSGDLSRRSRAYYDRLAQDHVEQDLFWDNPYDTEVWRLEHDISRPYLDPNKPILDVGCGFYPHDDFPRSVGVIAGDISFDSLRIARRNVPDGVRLDVTQFDAHQLPFHNCCFHQVIAGGELLNHVGYSTVLAELHRVLCVGGVLLVEFGVKWCFDLLWAISDPYLGGQIGYAVTREQARKFLWSPSSDVDVTWDITQTGPFDLKLLSVKNVRRAVKRAGFQIEKILGTNVVSGLIPLPWQQDNKRLIAQWFAKRLIKIDRLLGQLYPLSVFAGNVFILCKKKRA